MGYSNGNEMSNDCVIALGNVNPSGRGINGNVISADGICSTLTTNKGEGQKIAIAAMRGRPDENGVNHQQVEFRGDEITNTLTSVQKDNLLVETQRVRKLTPKECWRLMGFDDSDIDAAAKALNENIYNGKDRSGSQLYKQAGNSIVVDVLFQIFNSLYDAMPYLFDDMTIGSFFSGIGAFEKALDKLENVKNNTY